MVPVMLQACLVEDFKTFLAEYHLKNVDGQLVPINIYPQYLPAKEGQNDKKHFPYIVVGLTEGEDPGEEEPNRCQIVITIGVFDRNPNYTGYLDVLNMVQKIYDHLTRTRVFAKKYELTYPIRWGLHDEDRFPFFFGGLETNWTVGKITPVDTFI
jgi:hypothetical protein